MNGIQSFGFDWLRTQAATDLLPEHFSDFQRLIKTLRYGSKFQFIVAEFNNGFYRDELIKRIDGLMTAESMGTTCLNLAPESTADLAALETQLSALSANYPVIHVLGGEHWFDDQRWQAFNLRREAIAHGVAVRLVFWLTSHQITRLALMAPDFWAWRSGVFSFERPGTPMRALPILLDPLEVDNRSLTERSRRLAEINDWLVAEPPLNDELRIPLLTEMAALLVSIDRWDDALEILTSQLLPFHEKSSDRFGVAKTYRKIANILFMRGQLSDALSILQSQVRPVFEAMGNKIESAKTDFRIATYLGLQGHWEAAYNLLKNEVLVAAQQFEDVRLVAQTNFAIANNLIMQGDLDKGLFFLQHETLSIVEQLGDLRLVASVNALIAAGLAQRGQLDEAFRILTENALPPLQKLGDMLGCGLAYSLLAHIRNEQGQPFAALELLEQKVLPIYNNMGNKEWSVQISKLIRELRIQTQDPTANNHRDA